MKGKSGFGQNFRESEEFADIVNFDPKERNGLSGTDKVPEHPDQKKFNAVPPQFLEGIRLVPRNFDMPENKLHGDIVHAQLKYDLFYTAFHKVKKIFTRLV